MSLDEDLVRKGHREREKQRYSSKGEGRWQATSLSKSSLGSRWLSVRKQVHWRRGRICYNSRHIKIIIPCLQTSWLYIFKFFSQDTSLTYLPDYQWPLKCQDFLIWEGLLFITHQIAWIPRIHVGLWSHGREGTKSRVLGRIEVYNRRVVRWEHKDRDSSTERKSMTHYLA